MHMIISRTRGLLADVWEVVRVVAATSVEFVRTELEGTGIMVLITFGLAFVGGVSGYPVLLALAMLSAYRWGQLTMQSDARIICDECQRELEVKDVPEGFRTTR